MITVADHVPTITPERGVAFVGPPAHLLSDALTRIADAVATLPPEADAALVGIVTDRGTNAAFVARLPGGFAVQAWIGKNWGGKIDTGAGFVKTFKFGK